MGSDVYAIGHQARALKQVIARLERRSIGWKCRRLACIVFSWERRRLACRFGELRATPNRQPLWIALTQS
jgi:hypothetical protein